jgi:hypothetical protein
MSFDVTNVKNAQSNNDKITMPLGKFAPHSD